MAKTRIMKRLRAGRVEMVTLMDIALPADPPAARAAKSKLSSHSKQVWDRKASCESCELVMASNFDVGDYFCTFTFRDECLPHTREETLRASKAFCRLLRASRKKRREVLKYIKCVEHIRDDGSEGRWHIHMVLNGTGSDFEEIRALWSRWGDNVEIDDLLSDGWDYAARAKYMCKERQPSGKQGWIPSKGLLRPERTTELVDSALTLAPPPGAVKLDGFEIQNAWGSFVYLKYMLPYRPRLSRRRRMPKRTE